MRIKSIINGITILPGELECWAIDKDDYVYIKTTGKTKISLDRSKTMLVDQKSGLFQCSYGSFLIQNIGYKPNYIQIIKFHCGVSMQQKDFILTHFDQSPFNSILCGEPINDLHWAYIVKILESIKTPQKLQLKIDNIDPRLVEINNFIKKNYTKPLSLQDLADYVGLHPTYLCNSYSKVFKKSPIYFVNQLRLKKAIELIEQPELSITQIAKMVGYNNLSQFSSIFKRFYLKSPSMYREEKTEIS